MPADRSSLPDRASRSASPPRTSPTPATSPRVPAPSCLPVGRVALRSSSLRCSDPFGTSDHLITRVRSLNANNVMCVELALLLIATMGVQAQRSATVPPELPQL